MFIQNVVVNGFQSLHYFGLQFQAFIAGCSLLYSLWMVELAVRVWNTQQEHARMLQDVRFMVSNGKYPVDWKKQTFNFLTKDMRTLLQKGGKGVMKRAHNAIDSGVAAAGRDAQGLARDLHLSESNSKEVGQVAMNSANAAIDTVNQTLDGLNKDSTGQDDSSSPALPPPDLSDLSASKRTHIASLNELIDYIQNHDVPPEAFGIKMTPTLLQVLYGYAVSAVLALASRYATNFFA